MTLYEHCWGQSVGGPYHYWLGPCYVWIVRSTRVGKCTWGVVSTTWLKGECGCETDLSRWADSPLFETYNFMWRWV